MNILNYFISRQDRKETTKETIKEGAEGTQTVTTVKTVTTTTFYNVPNDLKEILTKEILNNITSIKEI